MIQTFKVPLQPKQRDLAESLDNPNLSVFGIGGAKGGGKLSPLDSTVYTPSGPVMMGEIVVGSKICNPDGSVSSVVAVWPHPKKDVYAVTFDDGASLEVGMDHLWMVRGPGNRRFDGTGGPTKESHRWSVVDTATLIEHLKAGRRIFIPLTTPVAFEAKPVPIHPYFLGVLLGDGSFSCGRPQIGGSGKYYGKYTYYYDRIRMTCADPAIGEKLQSLGIAFSTSQKKQNKAKEFLFSQDIARNIAALGLAGKKAWQKFIPNIYLVNSVENRKEMLRGLMDTDGSADKRGHCSYSTTSKQLADNVLSLSRSLGYKSNVTCRESQYTWKGKRLRGRPAYKVWIKGDEHGDLFSLPRKIQRGVIPYNGSSENGGKGGHRSRRIMSIKFTRKTDCQCISVDHPNGLYLANDYIVTHNTDGLRKIMILRRFQYPKTMGLVFRRVYNDLNDTHITRMFRDYPFLRPFYNKNERLMMFPNGSSIRFGYAETDTDIDQYNGKEFHDIFVDQAEQCSVYQIGMLKGCKRPPSGSECNKSNIVMSFNPGGPCHDWLRRKFVDADRTEDEEKEGWKFIQAYAWDNAHFVKDILPKDKYTVADYYAWPEPARRRYFLQKAPYAQTLKSFPDQNMVDAYLWGKWDVFNGQFFSMLNDAVHLCDDDEYVDSYWQRRGAIDYGNVTVFSTGSRDFNGEIIIDDAVKTEVFSPSAKAEVIGNLLLNRGLDGLVIVGDTDMFGDYKNYSGAEKSPAQIFKETWNKMFLEAGKPDAAPRLIQVQKRTEDSRRYRVLCNEAFKEYLRWERDKESGELKFRPRIRFKRRVKESYDTLKTLQFDENNPEDLDGKIGDDHSYDSFKMLLMSLRTPAKQEEVLTFEKNPRAFLIQQIMQQQGLRSNTTIGPDGKFATAKTFMQY